MKYLFLTCFLLFFANISKSDEIATVIKIRGIVTYNGTLLKENDIINKEGSIVTSDKSFIKLEVSKWSTHISVGANSKLEISSEHKTKITLDEGICRWNSFIRESLKNKEKGMINTRTVSLGVRGTDFLLKVTSILGESEVIMFDGAVLFSSITNPQDAKEIVKGQWGGFGGRFGTQVSPILTLPDAVLKSAESSLD